MFEALLVLSWRFRLWPRFACLSLLQTQHRVRLDAICAPLIHTIHQRSHKTAMKFSVTSQCTAPCTCYLMKWPDGAVCVRTSCDRTTSFLTHHAPHTQTSTSPKIAGACFRQSKSCGETLKAAVTLTHASHTITRKLTLAIRHWRHQFRAARGAVRATPG